MGLTYSYFDWQKGLYQVYQKKHCSVCTRSNLYCFQTSSCSPGIKQFPGGQLSGARLWPKRNICSWRLWGTSQSSPWVEPADDSSGEFMFFKKTWENSWKKKKTVLQEMCGNRNLKVVKTSDQMWHLKLFRLPCPQFPPLPRRETIWRCFLWLRPEWHGEKKQQQKQVGCSVKQHSWNHFL